jgi:hypothetical protein
MSPFTGYPAKTTLYLGFDYYALCLWQILTKTEVKKTFNRSILLNIIETMQRNQRNA